MLDFISTVFPFNTGTILITELFLNAITVQAQDMGACHAGRPTTKAMTSVGYPQNVAPRALNKNEMKTYQGHINKNLSKLIRTETLVEHGLSPLLQKHSLHL